ncbi:hypothetical protein IIB79_00660 [candidate division KSB1 bacterium]|nr:hypothetical protein [candidate division KSB1 bacterium]
MSRVIIGIGHKARQGKDTAAERLQKIFECTIIHFADALYEECRNATILYKEEDKSGEIASALYLKTNDEDYYHFTEFNDTITGWIKKNGVRIADLPYDADLRYDGMTEKDGTLLQFWGTEFRRKEFNWDYWVDIVKKEIEANPDRDYIIPDTRFKNEAKMISAMGGVVWKINRTGYTAKDRDPNHMSEVDLDDWEFDTEIINDGSISELNEKAVTLFRKMKGLPDGNITGK